MAKGLKWTGVFCSPMESPKAPTVFTYSPKVHIVVMSMAFQSCVMIAKKFAYKAWCFEIEFEIQTW